MKPLVIAVCVVIILVSLGQLARRSCTLATSMGAPDRRLAVCIVRVP